MNELNIAELRELYKKATTGPWTTLNSAPNRFWVIDGENSHVAVTGCNEYGISNAALIVAAVNALPALLDRIEKLEAIEKAAEKVTSPHSGSADIRWDWYDTHMPALRAALDAKGEK